MADHDQKNHQEKPLLRPLGGTEYNWCRAVPGGTGITVLALLFSKNPDISILQNALNKLLISHPILRSKLTSIPTTTTTTTTTSSSNNGFAYLIPPTPQIQIKTIDASSTSHLLSTLPNSGSKSQFHRILEHELNQNVWSDPSNLQPKDEIQVFFPTSYSIEEDSKWVLAFRLHTSICDRTSAVTLMTELMSLVREEVNGGGGGVKSELLGGKDEVNLGIEELVPSGKAVKPFWARGKDLIGYSLNSFRFSNLDFRNTTSPRSSAVVRLQMTLDETRHILDGCEANGIKLSGVISSAALIAAYSMKDLPDNQWEKYAVVTLVDCRKFLDPPLQSHNIGFYHSGILNTHDINDEAELWELASRCYTSVTNAKNSNKQFTDMADLNFLMCKAIDNPSLTPSSSMRTSFIAVFEDPVFENSGELHQETGLVDYVGCSSLHGVGPSLAVFDTIRNGVLDLACVYPKPLHSEEQMQMLIDQMKRTLIEGCD